MFFSRDKLFLTCLMLVFSLAPCFGQIGTVPGVAGGLHLPGEPPQGSRDSNLASSGTITGTVVTRDNKPVANARVEISSLEQVGLQPGSRYTGRDGSFIINNLPPGDYELRADLGVQEASQRVQVIDGETWVTLRLPASRAQGGEGGAPAISVRQLRVPDKAVSLLGKARRAIGKNRLDRAARYIAKALAAYPEYAEALALRGVLELQHQQFEQAATDAHHAIQADPSYGVAYLVMGAALNGRQKFQDALPPLQRAESLAPDAWQAYFESSKALLRLGKFQESLQQANRATALEAGVQDPEVHLVKAYAYVGLRTFGPALNELRQYLNQAPSGPYAQQARAWAAKIQPLAVATTAH